MRCHDVIDQLALIPREVTIQHKRNPNKMKTITMRVQKSSRLAVMLLATVVVIITSICVVNAAQTIQTPNAAFISYNLVAGANSAPITPTTNKSVLVMGCCTTTRGVGQVSLQHIPGNGMIWVGLESYPQAAITSGSNAAAGAHIVYIDYGHFVDIQTASADTILVHNGGPNTKTGNVTLVW
jgi:hypothetical protein